MTVAWQGHLYVIEKREISNPVIIHYCPITTILINERRGFSYVEAVEIGEYLRIFGDVSSCRAAFEFLSC